VSILDLRARHHAALENLVLLEYRLTCRTGVYIGAGKSADLAGSDLPVMRDAAGRPLIPGSSLRGVLRAGIGSFCEALKLDSVRLSAEDGAEQVPGKFAQGWRSLTIEQRLFGAIAQERDGFSYGSRFQISDALCRADVAVELRDGVGIDRDTRTAAQGVKFDLEAVPADTQFHGSIRFKNPAGYELGLLAQALWMLDQGLLLLGGKSARGLGWVQVEVTAPRSLDAKAILDRKPRPPVSNFGPVEEKMSDVLTTLQELADRVSRMAS
jgi:CRISPR-associated RAMP protein (TIGR02581 family)